MISIKLVVLTTKCEFGAGLLRHLKAGGIIPYAIIVEQSYRYTLVKHYIKIKGITETIKTVIKRAAGIVVPGISPAWRRNEFYGDFSENICIVNDLSGKQCEFILKEIGPDIVALGRTRILRENIINILRIGILNAHPGLLPEYRGIDTIEWAIYNQDSPGATIHFIDKGVDTGPVIVQKAVEIEPGDTLDSLHQKVDALSIELMYCSTKMVYHLK